MRAGMLMVALAGCGGPEVKPEPEAPDTEVVDTEVMDTEVVDTDPPEPVDTDDGIVRLTTVDGVRLWQDDSLSESCLAYRHPGEGYLYEGEVGSGVYRVSGDDGPREVYCDQETDGGGWTLVVQLKAVADLDLNLCTEGAVGQLDLEARIISAPAKMANAEIDAIWDLGSTRELLIKHDQDGWTHSTRDDWDRVCTLDFVDGHGFSTDQQSSALTDLDVQEATCTVGLSLPLVATNNNPYFCGWSFLSSGGSQVVAYSSTGSYLGGTCQQANAGRAWFGPPNSGCNAQKLFVR